MALTRSATRSTGATPEAAQQTTAAAQTKSAASTRKRKSPEAAPEPAQKKSRATKAKAAKAAASTASGVKTSPTAPNTAVPTPVPNAEGEELVPAVLTFSFEEARRHLVRVDPRFEDVFRRVKCRPFEHLERVDPFRYARDLGVQKGMLRWFVSLHSPSTHPVSLRKDKLSKEDETEAVAGNLTPSMGAEGEGGSGTMPRAATPDASSILPAPDAPVEPAPVPKGKGKKKAADDGGSENPLPAPFTPSIAQTLNMKTTTTEDGGKYTPPPLPEGLTVAMMKNRLSGKKVK
ncbi:hypothetical protein TRAPUB_14227 [Trametes pubescens]|uniref:Uncharacterized protein n=1 Tax=Trametes pubescens TaxID=154538 RepID=A0A1M2VNY6_TRAPU|nr:hypothetical protein TRAPUB_14227 [Trametes pubescens]